MTATENLSPALLFDHHDGTTQCEYDVTFEPSVESVGSSGVTLVLTPGTHVLSSTTTSVTGAYDAVRAARVQLINATTLNQHTPATRSGVVATVVPAASCSDSVLGTGTTEVPAAATTTAATRSAVLGENACEWIVSFANADSECLVTAKLMRDLSGSSNTNPVIREASSDAAATVTAGAFVSRRPR